MALCEQKKRAAGRNAWAGTHSSSRLNRRESVSTGEKQFPQVAERH